MPANDTAYQDILLSIKFAVKPTNPYDFTIHLMLKIKHEMRPGKYIAEPNNLSLK